MNCGWMKCAAEPSLLVIQGPLKMLPGDSRIFFYFFYGVTQGTPRTRRGGRDTPLGHIIPTEHFTLSHSQRLRGHFWFLAYKSRTGGKAFSYQAPLQWNQFPVWIQRTDTLPSFKTDLKSFLFDKAYSQSWIRGTWIIPYLCCFWLGHLKFIFHFHLLCISVHEVLYSLSHSLFFVLVYLYSPPPSCNKGVLPSHCYQVLP